MKYPDDFINKIICGDCLEIMKQMPDKCVDLVLTDPPYGIGKDGQRACICKNPKHNRKEHKFMGWDNDIPKKEVFDEIFRVSKNQFIWGGNYFVEHLKPSMGWFIWDKGQDLNQSDAELAYTSFPKALKRKIINRVELLKDGTKHPTQKPLRLMAHCLNYAEEPKLVLDPFMGSGSTIVACKSVNIDFIGIEINPEYCEIAEKRLFNTQTSLF